MCAYSDDRWPLLVRSVESVLGQTATPGSIVVVVDHNPLLLAKARREFAGCAVLESNGPRGLSGARNTALAAAGVSDVIAFIDDDAHADQDWLERLTPVFCDPTVIGAGGRIIAEWANGRPSWFVPAFDWVVGCTYEGMPEVQSTVRNAIGSNIAFRTGPLRAIGGFSTRLGRQRESAMGAEETEVCIRLTRDHPGSRIVYAPAARVFHTVPPSRARLQYFARRCFAEGVSKARLATMVGTDAALASERSYATRVLPRAAASAIASGLRTRRIGTAAGAVAVAGGLGLTAAGFAWGRLTGRGKQPA